MGEITASRVVWSFLILVLIVFLWLLPVSDSVYAFRTDLRTDRITVETLAAVTTGNVTLFKAVYDDDVSTIDIISSDSDDSPLYSSYNATTRLLDFSGLAASTNRTISVSYDIDAIEGSAAIDTLLDYAPWIYWILAVGMVAAAIAAIWVMRGA